MRVFLASIPLENTRVVVIGSGEAALAKLRLFVGSPAEVVWFAPEGLPEAASLPLSGPQARQQMPDAADLSGSRLVFIAVEDEAEAARLAEIARGAGAQVNVVDRPALGDFQTPAFIDRDQIVVAIATGGTAPILARDLRSKIEAILPAALGPLARLAGELRDTVKTTVPDFLARRRFWERAFRGTAADLVAVGKPAEARREMLRLLNVAAPEAGVVHIVGAGPGDPELLTLKALRVLQDADVIIHDRLVPEAVLARARRDARRLYVGKTRGDHSVPQDQIEALMIEEARAGQRVVRLKGGDPFVFGRGGEELEAMRRAGVPVFVVPGVTAALACAASAGIPLTHRDHAQSVTFVTAQEKPGGIAPDWARLAGPNQTLAIYMGAGRAAETAASLIAAGRSQATPVAIVENGSRPDERVITGTLDDLGGLVARANLTGPALLFVGECAAFSAAQLDVRAEVAA
ncbi:uroporphyrinogen-III C-methyltransferase [Brevundimonas sp. LM2]|uniref:siroheme synthase CysG n=1 Tax=Brevundimonas sp. LM2 TaxID=1938605 RepID=UPI000983EFCC|nr:siroheme synthase CysG [Brevundimonas sp. LM2]AQR61457.1 uroporphyrinogen-III C-methyltransferase [Brevundimonas sp. LM2]